MDEATRQRLADGEACLQAALKYLALGLSSLALCPSDHVGVGAASRKHSKSCQSPGKRPWHTWSEFQDRLPTEDEVRHWWALVPNSNVGIALGPVSKAIRIDVDSAAAEFKLQTLSGGNLPPTWQFRGDTSLPKRGLLYQIPAGVVLQTTKTNPDNKEELRFQAKGAQTAMPPSRHPKGMIYAWEPGHSPEDRPLALMPDWLIEIMSVHASPERNGQPSKNGFHEKAAEAPDVIEDGKRHTILLSLAGTMRRRGMNGEEILAALRVVNERRCRPPLSDQEVSVLSEDVATRYQPVDTDQEEIDEALRLGNPLNFLKARKCFQRVPLARVRKLGRERGEFGLILDDGRIIELGKAKDVLAPALVQGAIADVLHIAIPEARRSTWRPIGEAILMAAVIDDQPQTSEAEETRTWLAGFSEKRARRKEEPVDLKNPVALAAALRKIMSRADYSDRTEDGRFWTTDDELVVHAPLFMSYLGNPAGFNVRLNQAQATTRLRRLGFDRKQLSARDDVGIAKAKLWVSPPHFLKEDQHEQSDEKSCQKPQENSRENSIDDDDDFS
jgi:hypothetical protein